jgi:VanZ family protein
MSPRRFAIASVAAALLVLSAPFLGQIRSELRRAFPDQFVWIVGGLVAAGVLAGVLFALARIRERRVPRHAAIALALATAGAYAFATAGENRDSNVVELFHFLQYGVVTLLFYRACLPMGDAGIVLIPLMAGLVVGTAEEGFQWFLPARVGEIRDLGLNLAAIACGLLFSVGAIPPPTFRPRLGPESARLSGRFAAAALLALGVFVHVVHLGHVIEDEEIGRFASRYARERLLSLQAERMARWRVDPPPPALRRLSREDQYLTEGIQHAQWRNRRWDAGDVPGAWAENRILEKYYAPVLDIRSYAAPGGVRWPDAQRADAERRAAGADSAVAPRTYVSGAYPYPVFPWPAIPFWLAVATCVALVLMLAKALERRSRLESSAAAG